MICFPGEMQRGETGNPATVVPKLPKGRCFLLRINVSRRGLRAEENRFGEKFAAPRLDLKNSMRQAFSRWKMGTGRGCSKDDCDGGGAQEEEGNRRSSRSSLGGLYKQ